MSFEKVAFGFFIVLALTLNVAFVTGDIDNPAHHSVCLLFASDRCCSRLASLPICS